MRLTLERKWLTAETTIGSLYIDGKFECYILEDRYRLPGTPKVYGKTAIPCGEYLVQITASPKFKRDLPLLLNVPNYTGVRIHTGNDADDTEGCLLTGRTRSLNHVGESVLAFNPLFAKLDAAGARVKPVSFGIFLAEWAAKTVIP